MISKGLAQRLLLAGTLAVGFILVWGIVGVWVVEQIDDYIEKAPQSRPAEQTQILLPNDSAIPVVNSPSAQWKDPSLIFLPDGTPRLRYMNQNNALQYTDLEGKVTPQDENSNQSELATVSLPALPKQADIGDRTWDQRICSFSDGSLQAVFWYFISDGRQSNETGYFVGYDSKSYACVGFLGTAGFRRSSLPSEELIPLGDVHATSGPVPSVLGMQSGARHPGLGKLVRSPNGFISPWDVYVPGREGKVYHIDLQKREIHIAFVEPRLCSLGLLSKILDSKNGRDNYNWLAARTHDALLVLDHRGQLLKRYPLPEALHGQDIQFAETTTEEAVVFGTTSPMDDLTAEVEYQMYWMTPDGRSRQAAVTLPRTIQSRYEIAMFLGVAVPVPLVLSGYVAFFRPLELLGEQSTLVYGEAFDRALTEFWPVLAIIQLISACLAILCYRRQIRYRASGWECVMWPLFVLLFGLPGWVAYRFGRSWPVLEACPACSTSVPQDRGDCAHCETDFPEPALRGTEVFA